MQTIRFECGKIINMKRTIVISKNYGKGNSSRRVLIKEGKEKYLVKITDIEEINTLHKYVPKLYSLNDNKYRIYNTDCCKYIYKYQFIKGEHINEVKINDKIFVELIKTFRYFSQKKCLVWDCHMANIIITRDSKIYFVDLGGISKIPMEGLFYPIILPSVEPDERKSDNYPESLKTEQFIIYYLSYRLLTECHLDLSDCFLYILREMNEPETKNRPKSFNSIYRKCKQFLS